MVHLYMIVGWYDFNFIYRQSREGREVGEHGHGHTEDGEEDLSKPGE